MKLKNKISVIIMVIWGAMATLFYYGSQHIILNSYVRLENQTITENLNRTQATLNQAIDSIQQSVKDWSIWDETYHFMVDKSPKYIKSTLALSSLQSLNMDMILYYDTKGHLFYSMAIDPDRIKQVPLPQGLVERLTPDSPLVHLPNLDSSAQGMISIPSGILLIASHSIINSESKGPVHGTLVMAKYLNNQVLVSVENQIKLDATIFRVPHTINQTTIAPVYQDLLHNQSSVFVKNTNQLFGYQFLKDINGTPIAILKIEMPRNIYQIGVETTRYSNIFILFYSIVVTVLLWALLQYLIVKRIEKLSKNIGKINKNDKMLSNLIENISDEVSSVAELYHQATHDPLTGLANRNLLHQAFQNYASELSDEQKIVIIFIDLDHFKRINDTLGHDVGDKLLMETAKRLTSSLRGNDLAARLGGDEFVVMLVDIEEEQIEAITNRLFKIINRPVTHNNHDIFITCSMGVCVYPNDGDSIETLIKQADMALYHAKGNGRNHYQFYSQSLSQAINAAHQNEIELQYALDENQLCIYYQPIFNLRTKQISSMEALIRWNHPTRGLLTASDIIPVAERTDLIYPIGAWVLNTACAQLKAWQDKGLPIVPVAVNVASAQMKANSLSQTIINALHESGLNSKFLEIEITETGFIDLTPRLLNELEGLKASGIKLTIDDFGTGYAGLGYLKSLPVEKLKIDQTFTRDIISDPDDKSITIAIITIAHQLNLKVTAEGVENIDQYNFMCHFQVDEAQGYFLCEPLSADNCEKLLSGELTIQGLQQS